MRKSGVGVGAVRGGRGVIRGEWASQAQMGRACDSEADLPVQEGIMVGCTGRGVMAIAAGSSLLIHVRSFGR